MFRMTMLAAATALSTSVAFAAMTDRPEVLPGNTSNASAAEITSKLQALGYERVQDARLSGDIYTASAYWEGEPVSVHIDRDLGDIENRRSPDARVVDITGDASPSEFAASLEAAGYTQVRDVTKAGNIFRATADRNGLSHRLRVDADNGVVTNYEDRTGLSIARTDGMKPAEVEDELRAIGFKNPEYVAQHGQMIAAKGVWKGERVNIDIDTQTGNLDVAERQQQ